MLLNNCSEVSRKGTVYEDIYKELEAIAMKDERLLEAFTQWQELSLSNEQYHAYEGRLKRILDEEAVVIEAKLREEEALEKGKSIEKRDTVIRLAQLQLSLEQIATATELGVKEVENILIEADIH